MALTISKEFAINPGTAATSGRILVLHSTATPNAPAKNIASYEHREWKSAETFVHFAVDDTMAYQIGTPGRKAWGAGNVNSKAPVQIELCEFSDKKKAMNAYKNFIALARLMAGKYGIPLTLDDGNKTAGCKSHRWCSRNYGGSDHSDPYQYLPSIGISQAQFAADLKNGVGAVTVKESAATTPKATAVKSSAGAIASVQSWLNVNYGAGLAADNLTGPATKRGLAKGIQTEINKQFGGRIAVDGIFGAASRAAFKTVRKGAQGSMTKLIQGALICKGYSTNGFDGIFGGGTSNAVVAFQRSKGLSADGIVGPATAYALFS